LQTTWRALLSKQTLAFDFSEGKTEALETPDNQVLEIAQREQAIKITEENNTSTLIAPILYQDQVLGALKLKAPNRHWTNDELNLIESTLNQTALSLENTRLILETRTRAEQEKMLSDISIRMRETLDIETILQTTAQEMRKALQLAEIEVRLIPDQAQKKDDAEFFLKTSGE
jgi:GAF domain-containing protein